MDEEQARCIIQPDVIQPDNTLHSVGWYLEWSGGNHATLDGKFSAAELEAIAWWMRNKTVTR